MGKGMNLDGGQCNGEVKRNQGETGEIMSAGTN